MDFFPSVAIVNVTATNVAVADVLVLGISECRPALGALELKFDLAVGDGCHGFLGERYQPSRDTKCPRAL